VDGAELSAIAVNFTDSSSSRSASIAAVAFNAAPDAEFTPTGMRIGLGKPRISTIGLQWRDGANALALPKATVEAARFSMTTAGPRLELALDAPRVAAGQGLSTKQGEASLELTSALAESERVAMDLSGAGFTGAIDGPRILLTGLVAGQGGQGARLDEHSFEARRIALRSAPAHFEVDIEALRSALADLKVEAGEQGLDLRAASVNGGTLSVAQTDAGLRVAASAPAVSLSGLAARQGDDQAALDVLTLDGATVTLTNANGGKLDLALERVKAAADKLALKQGSAEASLDRLSLDSAAVALTRAAEGRLDLALRGIKAAADKVALKQGENGLDLGKASLGGDSILLAQAGARIGVQAAGASAALAGVAGRRGKDRLALQDASFETRTLSVSTGSAALASSTSSASAATAGGAASAAATSTAPTSGATLAAMPPPGSGPLQARLEQASLRLNSLGVVALGAGADIAGVSAASLDAGSLRLALPAGGPELSGDGLNATLSGAVLRSPADATELVQLGSASLGNGALALRERSFSADKLALANGKASTWLDAEGRFNLTSLFAAEPPLPTEATTPSATAPTGQASAPAWRIALKSAELDGLAAGFEDRRESPAFAVGLEALSARLIDLDTGAAAPMQVEARARLGSGGELEATGTVHAGSGASYLNLKVSALALAPVQSYLSKFAELRLASGSASTEGRLRYGSTAEGGAMLAYQGALSVDRLLLEEIAPQRPFLSWKSVATSDLLLTLEPNKVDIGELRVVQPAGRLIIAEDQTVNLTDVLKKPRDEKGAVAEKQATPGDETAAEPFPVSIARVRVDGGMLEFADLSLRPQFAARMHDLKGVITGLGTDVDQSAQVQLDARVDKFGSARIRGQLSVLQPERLTDIEMTFRNLEMTSLSPYVVRFAGYRIAAGRLALDLQYKVKASKLLGRNKVVLQQVALGEKVESPGALDLPLELAIAILKDSKGVIDIELPVSGDLNDPKFDYGAVIGKAVGNMLGGIVTAPFRALGALFGGGAKEIDTIEFEPGSDAIAPPEAQKLAAVARALTERPALTLVVPPTYAAEYDTPVLKSRAVRGAIAARMGLSVQTGEDPGPIDAANPRAQRAIEEVFSQRYAPEVLAVLKGRAIAELAPKASPAAPPPGRPSPSPVPPAPPASPASPASAAEARPPTPPPSPPAAFYKNLLDRLISEQPMDEQELAAFATRRGEAIVRELTDVGGVPAGRVKLDRPRAAAKADDKTVVLLLELEVKQ
jgi:hypothetical protein